MIVTTGLAVTTGGAAAVPPMAPHRPAAAPGKPPEPTAPEAAAEAKSAVDRNRPAVNGGPDEKYTVRSVVVDEDGTRHVRLDRTYRGLAVLGGDFVVHTDAGGSLRGATVAHDRVIDVATRPAVSRKRAGAVATAAFKDPVEASAATLVVDAAAGAPVLAWQVRVVGAAPEARSVEYVVDARTGAVRRAVDAVHPAAADGTGRGLHAGEVRLSTTRREDGNYELADPDRGGSAVRDGRNQDWPELADTDAFVDADNAWGDGSTADPATLAVDVHHGVQQTWDYFARVHGRAGMADDGRGAVAVVHDRANDANASWDSVCRCMRFGGGDSWAKPFTSLDVVAHEYAHGVTEATANLEYWAQSGALNEATSDIFGTLVEFAAASPADPPDYLIGELLDYGGEGRPLRYMDDPARDGSSVGCWDGVADRYLDVHYLSGVPNKFFFTLAEGSARSEWGAAPPCAGAAPVAGIGRDKAAAIWYRALTRYMVSTTGFREAREATLRSAEEIHGKDSPEYAAVDAAWAAVHVTGAAPAPEPATVVQPADRVDRAGTDVRLQIEAVNPKGERLRFRAANLPEGLTISEDGLITGTPVGDSRSYPSVTATSDLDGHTDTKWFTWEIQAAPVLDDPSPQQQYRVGDVVSLPLHATDRDLLTWSVTGLPDGLYHDDLYRRIGGQPREAGTFDITVTVTDSDGLSTAVTFALTVLAKPQNPPAMPQYLYAFWDASDVYVFWQPEVEGSEELTGYELTFAPGGPTVVIEDGESTMTKVENLDPAQAATVSIVAVSPIGRSEPRTVEVLR